MGIGKSSWKEAKEKAKAAGKKIRQKEEGPSPYNTLMIKSFKRVPVKGANEIKPAGVVKSSGSINAEDFKILQSRRDSAANYKNFGVGSPANIKRMCGK